MIKKVVHWLYPWQRGGNLGIDVESARYPARNLFYPSREPEVTWADTAKGFWALLGGICGLFLAFSAFALPLILITGR